MLPEFTKLKVFMYTAVQWTRFDLAPTSTSFFLLVCPGVHVPSGYGGGFFCCRGQESLAPGS